MVRATATDPLRIWVIDDSEEDMQLIDHALARARPAPVVEPFKSGLSAVEILRWRSQDAVNVPDLILLDLHLDDTHGLEVLQQIKDNHRLSRIPIVVLTGSKDDAEIQAAYSHQASMVLRKPNELKGLVSMMSHLVNAFMDSARVEAPKETRAAGSFPVPKSLQPYLP